MTVWTAAGVLDVTKRAGYPVAYRPVAVAVALTASGGDDQYHYEALPGPSVDARGLWAIDVVKWPQYASVDLYDPVVNAQAAIHLVTGPGMRWEWNPGWGGLGYADNLRAAYAAVSAPGGTLTRMMPPRPELFAVNLPVVRNRLDAVRALIAARTTGGGH